MPTDREIEQEKSEANYLKGWKDTTKYLQRHPKDPAARNPLQDVADEMDLNRARLAQAIKAAQEAGAYKPIPQNITFQQLLEMQNRMYPARTKTHDIKVADMVIGPLIDILWVQNGRFHGAFSPIIKQLIATIKAAYAEAGVNLKVIDDGKNVELSDKQGNVRKMPATPWMRYEYPAEFAGARKVAT